MGLLTIIATIEVVLCFIIFIGIFIKDMKQKEKRCNVKVKGKVVNRWTSERKRRSHFHGYETFIVIEYEYNQEIYSISVRISPFSKLKIRDTVEVMMNPLNPKETYKVCIPEELLERIEQRTKKKEKITDIIIKIIILTPIIGIIGFAIFFAVVLIFHL